MKSFRFTVLVLAIVFVVSGLSFGQAKKKKTTTKKTTVKTTPTPTTTTSTPQPVAETPPVTNEVKKNERPTDAQKTNSKTNASKTAEVVPVYFYEFSNPSFYVTKISIEHDEAGKGKITFTKKDFNDEAVSDPIELSPATLEKIKAAFDELKFLDSTENYQDKERDYAHLGNITLKMKKNGRERAAGFNWTQNEKAKFLMDEYRKIANQFVWIFDINLSRQNYPLESPRLLDTLDGYFRRDELSDPPQMIPFLQKLSNDERIPLIARNHATRLIKDIEKKVEKEKESKK